MWSTQCRFIFVDKKGFDVIKDIHSENEKRGYHLEESFPENMFRSFLGIAQRIHSRRHKHAPPHSSLFQVYQN